MCVHESIILFENALKCGPAGELTALPEPLAGLSVGAWRRGRGREGLKRESLFYHNKHVNK